MTYAVRLDGNLIPPGEYNETDESRIEWSRTDGEGRPTFQFAEQLTFTGAAGVYIREKLLCDAPPEAFILFELLDNCCTIGRVLFRGKISADNVSWCEIEDGADQTCKLKTDVEEYSPEAIRLRCLRSSLVAYNNTWSSGEQFHMINHPFVRYCTEQRPLFVAFALLFILTCINFILVINLPIILLVSAIVGAINAIVSIVGGNSLGDSVNAFLAPINTILNFFTDTLPAFFSGCGRGHISPLVRDYIRNACEPCNLKFQSPTFTDPTSPYFNVSYFFPSVKPGRLNRDDRARSDWRKANAPIENGVAFINRIADSFNHEWRIDGDTLLLYPKRATPITAAIDFTVPEARQNLLSFCIDANGEPTPEGISLRCTRDALDAAGNEVTFLYSDEVPNEPPVNPNLSGLEERQMEHAPMLFRQDAATQEADALAQIRFIFQIPPISALPINPFNRDIDGLPVMEKGIVGAPRFLALENNYDADNAKVVRFKAIDGGGYAKEFYYYNWPIWYMARFYATSGYNGPNAADYAIWYADSDPEGSQKPGQFGPDPNTTQPHNAFQFFIADDPRTTKAFRIGKEATLRVKTQCEYVTALLDAAEQTGRIYVKVRSQFCGADYLAEVVSLQYNRDDIQMTLSL